jgi:hypothetical protein
MKAVEYTVQRVLSTLPTDHYKASFSKDPFINPGFIRMGPQLPNGAAIFRVPRMMKFWAETADFEPKREQQNFLLEGFPRAPCSNRILKTLDSNVENAARVNLGEGSSSNQPVFEVNLSQLEGEKEVPQNASEPDQTLDSTVSVQFSNQNSSELYQNLNSTVPVQFPNQSSDLLSGVVQRTITDQENAAVEAMNAQNSSLLDEILAFSPISEPDISQFPSSGEDGELHRLNIDLFSPLDSEQSSISLMR